MTRALSFQSGYRCQRSGACCTSNWPIPIEADRLARLQAAVADGTLAAARTPWARPWSGSSLATPALLAADRGRCVFFETSGGHHCSIQSALGHDALPLACRQFPRVSVHDPRGTSIVLSCYCPTAAAMLDAPGPVTIVHSPSAFPDDGEYAGLETRDGWPPILRSGVLMDWPSWWAFESRAVNLIANIATSPDDALSRLTSVVAEVRAWQPGGVPLASAVDDAFDAADREPARLVTLDSSACLDRVASLHRAIPSEWHVTTGPKTPMNESPTRWLRFLACHAFANWAVHLGHDLEAWLDSIASAHALLASGFGVREADLWLRHLSPSAGLRDAAD